ncbi:MULTISPECIES: potassium-transporting ATPase subunit F [Nostoc]|uniref:Potassium-transporting ATPase subunit F n=1 Tax=Nostoc paludosum FACHB-159 TaxID=2692908 RepID=A0ABR8KDT4_9NOSO|nr:MULTISPECIES: potassium-transporting ATPase subunit F [Nostoc]MBD2680544.1 potassium-transporting ATPase subunit F [Nostoc sp. FACHB-857]MBD2736936.1 potassium-transporting ATPase subunit F [Nostoc paludosum FACHB-159]
MKLPHIQHTIPISQLSEAISEIWCQWRKQKLPLYLFLAMCFNLVVAPVVYAATSEQLSRSQAWGVGLLGLVTLGLSIYLFFVMFVPEKF